MRSICIWTGLWLAVTAGASPAYSLADDNQAWVRAATPNFELYTTEGEGSARAAILYLEQVRAFLARNNSGLRLPAAPVRVVALRSDREFRSYAPADSGGALFRSGIHHDTILMQGLEQTRYAAAVREYLHTVLSRAGKNIPYWLDQGMAEFYSTLKPATGAGSLRIGDIPGEHAAALARGPLLDLAVILGAGGAWRAGARREQVLMLTAQSWALTHMLALGDQYRAKFPSLVAEILSGTGAEDALQKVLGMSVAQIQGDLSTYIKDSQFKAYILPYGTERQLGQSSLRMASTLEWNLVLADLDALMPERRDQARRAYEKLAAASPQRWEPHAGLGYLALASRDGAAASRAFARAEELDCPDARLYLDWAALAPPSGDELVSIYRKAAALRPEDLETAYVAGIGLSSVGDCEGALRLLVPLKNVAPDRQAAHSRAIETCRTAVREQDSKAAPLVKPEPGAPVASAMKSAEGQMVQVDCLGSGAKIWLQTAGRRSLFVITQGESITLVRGGKEVTEDLRCGPQPQPPNVRLRYGDPPSMEPGVQGSVRVLEFL